MVEMVPFDPLIDRYDIRSAARLFQSFWPDPIVSRAVCEILAASIRAAHAAGDASWTVSMHSHYLRLNVGQVETLTLTHDRSRILFQSPLALPDRPDMKVVLSEEPVYPSVPVASGVCKIPSASLISIPDLLRVAHDRYIASAASYKRRSPFKNSLSPAILDHIDSVLGDVLPRPSYHLSDGILPRVEPLAEELNFSEPMIEGAKYRIVVNAYERDPRARRMCIARYGASCAICGFSFGAAYGSVMEGFIHVHHLRPLSEIGREYEVDPVADLRPVCPNCHAVLH